LQSQRSKTPWNSVYDKYSNLAPIRHMPSSRSVCVRRSIHETGRKKWHSNRTMVLTRFIQLPICHHSYSFTASPWVLNSGGSCASCSVQPGHKLVGINCVSMDLEEEKTQQTSPKPNCTKSYKNDINGMNVGDGAILRGIISGKSRERIFRLLDFRSSFDLACQKHHCQ